MGATEISNGGTVSQIAAAPRIDAGRDTPAFVAVLLHPATQRFKDR